MDANGLTSAPLVSVVVPFYNVEAYADACLASLEAQTFARCEFVCVDDGSTDGTAHVLERHAGRDGRIRLIRIEHAGLSAARNRGVELARADLVTFVDGDDVVSPEYVRSLYETYALGTAERRMALVASMSVYSGCVLDGWPTPEGADVEVLDRDEALRRLCLRRIGHTSWGKLAPRRLYLDAPFPRGMLYEDAYMTPVHYAWADELVELRVPLYGHVERDGSITRRVNYRTQDVMDIRSVIAHLETLSSSWDKDVRALVPWRLATHQRSVMWWALGLRDRRTSRPLRRDAGAFMRGNMRRLARIRRDNGLDWRSLVSFLAVGYMPHLCWVVRRLLDVMPFARRQAILSKLK